MEFEDLYQGDYSVLDEIEDQDFAVGGWRCTTNTFSLSNYLGNKGGWCTLTKECQPNCS